MNVESPFSMISADVLEFAAVVIAAVVAPISAVKLDGIYGSNILF